MGVASAVWEANYSGVWYRNGSLETVSSATVVPWHANLNDSGPVD